MQPASIVRAPVEMGKAESGKFKEDIYQVTVNTLCQASSFDIPQSSFIFLRPQNDNFPTIRLSIILKRNTDHQFYQLPDETTTYYKALC